MSYWLTRSFGVGLIVCCGLAAIATGDAAPAVGFLAGVVLFCTSEIIEALKVRQA